MFTGKSCRNFTGALASLLAVSVPVLTAAQEVEEAPSPPPPLSTVAVPSDPNLSQFIRDNHKAILLGKALFWDMGVGSDGMSCASCHFHAGVDNRVKNQLSPGLLEENGPDITFQQTASGGQGGPNYTLVKDDFPFVQFNDMNNRHSGITFQTNDVSSSQGVFESQFNQIPAIDKLRDECSYAGDPIFNVHGIQVRKVEPRNTPTMINAVFNFRNFWDGRANNVFNGVDPFGKRNGNAVVSDKNGNSVTIDLRNASLASQASGPPLSTLEMSCAERAFADIGQKMMPRRGLQFQKVHASDSVLGAYRHGSGVGINPTYEQLIKEAFQSNWWDNNTLRFGPSSQYTLIERNFSLFFGLALQAYQATLISDDAPYDRFADRYHDGEENNDELSASAKRGLDVFMNKGKCINCHDGSEFSGAASSLQKENKEGGLVERMIMGDGGVSLYDSGFYNIGVTPTTADLGVGANDPFGNPLSFSKQARNNNFVDPIFVNVCSFEEKLNTLSDNCVVLDENLAKGKSAKQSSTSSGGSASRAVDGNSSGNYWHNSVTHTDMDMNPWWQVDLGENYQLGKIELYNRTDCCSERLDDVYVFVSETDLSGRSFEDIRSDGAVWSKYLPGKASSHESLSILAKGRYVRVQLAGLGILSLAEVVVNEAAAFDDSNNLARGKTTHQSSTYSWTTGYWWWRTTNYGYASRAVDGNTNGDLYNNSVTHTNHQHQPWWQVDLGLNKDVGVVKLFNRTDCCTGRLKDFQVFVSQTDMRGRSYSDLVNDAAVSKRYYSGAAGSATTIPLYARGRYVRVQLSGWDFLSLAEAQVFGYTPTDSISLSGERLAVRGAFKTPILRNVELTGPYMHNGSLATLEQVVQFYNRGGNFGNHPDLDPDIRNLGLSDQEQADLVAFMKSLTDERVALEKAPFDRPQLIIPDGHPGDENSITENDGLLPAPFFTIENGVVAKAVSAIELPAVGADGRSAEGLDRLLTFAQVLGITSEGSPSDPVADEGWEFCVNDNNICYFPETGQYEVRYRWDATGYVSESQFVNAAYSWSNVWCLEHMWGLPFDPSIDGYCEFKKQ